MVPPGSRVAVAVSGGADSVALLRLLCELKEELGLVLSAMHFNHRLRGSEADADEQFVQELAARCQVHFWRQEGDVREHAAASHTSIETAARQLRYQCFTKLLRERMCDRVATAHTLDDQAETVLMRTVRGAGTRGLAGIYPTVRVSGDPTEADSTLLDKPATFIIRPLLQSRRDDVESYLKELGQDWREDLSNRDPQFTRNRVRHDLMPRLAGHLNPRVREALAQLADIARAEEDYWRTATEAALHRASLPNETLEKTCLSVPALQAMPVALQRRVLRLWGEHLGLPLEFCRVEEIRRMLASDQSNAALPHDWKAVRDRDQLRLCPPGEEPVSNYEHTLTVPGSLYVPEIHALVEAVISQPRKTSFDNTTWDGLTLRNWRPGDRFWPDRAPSPKKVKDLLQKLGIRGRERKLWPVIASRERLVWMRGLGLAHGLSGSDACYPDILVRQAAPPDGHSKAPRGSKIPRAVSGDGVK